MQWMRRFLCRAVFAALLAGPVSATERHLTLRLEDGLPRWENAGIPITIVLPVKGDTAGEGRGLAPFAAYGPYRIDGSGLALNARRISGVLTGSARDGSPSPTWAIEATIEDGRITGVATAPALHKRMPAVTSRVTGHVDPVQGGAWLMECGMPWTDKGSHKRLAKDGSNFSVSTIVRLRLGESGGTVVHVGSKGINGRTVQSSTIEGRPEAFTAELTCLAEDGKTPIRIQLEGGRIGRGGKVQAHISVTDDSWEGRVKDWTGEATVWAWPDAPGFVGGVEQNLVRWGHDAEADPGLAAAARKEAAPPIHPAVPGSEEVWTHNVLQRGRPRCLAPPQFDIRPLPPAEEFHLSVKRISGIPLTRTDKTCVNPFAALTASWVLPRDKKDKSFLGLHRYTLSIDGTPAWSMEAWAAGKSSREAPGWLVPVIASDRYRVRVIRDKETEPTIETTVTEPHDPLTAVWPRLEPGAYRLEVQGVNARGRPLGTKPWEARFVKIAPFDGPYFTGPARPYAEAALKLARWTADHPTMHELRGHGNYNAPGGGDNGGCQIMFGAVWAGLTRFHLSDNRHEREAGLTLAREACEHMRASCLARGGMPKTYKEGMANASLYGEAFLDLHAATKDPRWRDAATMVAEAFTRSQLENGTWAEGWDKPDIPAERLKVKHFPGHTAVYEAGLIPGIHGSHLWEYDASEVLWFLGRLRKELDTDAFRTTEDKAYRWVMDNSVKAFFWRDQGHHSPCMVPPFRHTGRCASYFARYLLEAAPAEKRDLGLVAELMRFSESCHLNWSRSTPGVLTPNLVGANIRESGAAIWLGTRFALVWVKLGRETGNPLHVAKARALMDAVTHAQHPETGNVATGLSREIAFNRFATNAGRCAWNLRAYSNLPPYEQEPE
ncbi:MAG: hypothetical protein AAF492_03070 [Verrucomicrobiota bacterium]